MLKAKSKLGKMMLSSCVFTRSGAWPRALRWPSPYCPVWARAFSRVAVTPPHTLGGSSHQEFRVSQFRRVCNHHDPRETM